MARIVPTSRAIALGILAALTLLSAWVLARHVMSRRIEPTRSAIAVLAERVSVEASDSDAIALLPTWSANERWRYEAILKRVGAPPDRLLMAEPLELWDVEGAARLWVVSTHDLGARYAASLPRELELEHQEDFGFGVSLRRYAVPASRVAFDFRRRLDAAEVSRLLPEGAPAICKWNGKEHGCGSDWWKGVWAGLNEVGDTRRECIFVQPWPDRGTLRLLYRNVPLGATLEGRFGLRLWALRHDEGSDVHLRVRVGPPGSGAPDTEGSEVAHLCIERSDPRWLAFSADVQDRGVTGDVAFEISAEQSVWRQACLDARTRLTGTDAGAP